MEQKIAAAKALGLWEKVLQEGWGGLTSRESGAIGAFMTHRLVERPQLDSDDSPTALL
jgi:hypothetical protein